ncbi:hypothetical protein SAMN05216554_2085 [Herbiconiux ginsengi]|uniref:Uncharacterized protein n=1 Tax=Herbiconiux ginsengi TaxID=381665 RepID=A0A1H3PV12_9MICO|nr:hypothetical protein SAMN05216554_2085 [Herbiconiux ginsengi]
MTMVASRFSTVSRLEIGFATRSAVGDCHSGGSGSEAGGR